MRGRSDPLWGVGALFGIMGLLVAACAGVVWLKLLGWWTLLVLVPAFVVEISLVAQRVYC